MSRPLRILVAPLNWGLGHATRCIPIIQLLQERGCDVVLASDGPALALLKDAFPDLPAFELPGIDIRYGERFFALRLAAQFPALFRAVRQERQAVARLVRREAIDGLISDNRFGSWGSGVPDVVLSHQWAVETGNALSRWVATRLHRRILKRYGRSWIPDNPGSDALAGRLSQAADVHATAIGPLSRFEAAEAAPPERAQKRILVICSGPEPLRTRFEEQVLAQAARLPYSFLIAQGRPGQVPTPSPAPNVECRAYMDAKEVSDALAACDVVVSRTGYTTLMDLAATGAKALLVPTPGQPEQEYLGRYCRGRGWWVIQDQAQLDLATGIKEASLLPGAPRITGSSSRLERAMDTFLGQINPA